MLCWSSTKRSNSAVLGMRAAPVRGTTYAPQLNGEALKYTRQGYSAPAALGVTICRTATPKGNTRGRFVLQGNEVRVEEHEAAIFQELSSTPASIEAAKNMRCLRAAARPYSGAVRRGEGVPASAHAK